MNIQITPNMTVEQLSEILERHKGRDVETFIRIETIRGKPCAYLVREPRIPLNIAPVLLARQAE